MVAPLSVNDRGCKPTLYSGHVQSVLCPGETNSAFKRPEPHGDKAKQEDDEHYGSIDDDPPPQEIPDPSRLHIFPPFLTSSVIAYRLERQGFTVCWGLLLRSSAMTLMRLPDKALDVLKRLLGRGEPLGACG
jgi:hypothetical protein